MSKKNILLSIFFVFSSNLHAFEYAANPSLIDWLKSFFTRSVEQQSKFKESIARAAAEGKALDLQSFFKEKEQKDSFMDPTQAAQKFRKAIQRASQKNPLMTQFKFGASSSSYQYEGGLDNHNASAIFYKEKGLESAGKAIDFWNRYKQDIAQMKHELGINCFRISIAWDRVQPENGDEWNMQAIEQYRDIIKTLKAHNIEPIIVLHHYTIPQWFADLGGFEKSINNKYFVNFAKKMYEALHVDVTRWSTFNAIEGYAFKGYYTLDGAPGIKEKKGLLITEKVMYNMLSAHAQVYKAIKGLYYKYQQTNPTITNPQIGIQKNIVLFDPFEDENASFCERKGSQFICGFSSLLNNSMFFKLIRYKYYDSLDWIGLNIYSNMFMLYAAKQQETNEDRKTENFNYRDYPEGIYRAVKIISDQIARPLNIPIFITENGIATKNNAEGDEKRTRFFRRALYTIRKLIEEGYPIIGYTPWASHDNYEWPSHTQPNPYDRPYGLFHVDFTDEALPRTLKKGAYFYRDFIKEYFNPMNIDQKLEILNKKETDLE